MRILFIHQNFPGQFRHLAPMLAACGHEVHALAIQSHAPLPGVHVHRYQVRRPDGLPPPHPLLRDAETKVLRGEACARAMLALSRRGWVPDLVIAHPGWGEALFVKDVFPQARLICLMEFYYGSEGADVGFDPEFDRVGVDERVRLRMRNTALSEALLQMDHGVVPTAWQASRMPAVFASRLSVVFDGIDTAAIAPDPQARFQWPALGLDLGPGDQVLSFVNRNLEPYRGYHRFLRALPRLQRQVPEAQVVIVGGDGVSYGAAAPAGTTWKEHFLAEVKDQLDLSRVHFTGLLPRAALTRLLQVARAHVYLTYPFVLSWSCLEALSVGGHVIGSRTAPVQDFIEDGRNGSLVDFFDTDGLADTAARVLLAPPEADAALRAAARRTAVERCDLHGVCLPQWQRVIEQVCG